LTAVSLQCILYEIVENSSLEGVLRGFGGYLPSKTDLASTLILQNFSSPAKSLFAMFTRFGICCINVMRLMKNMFFSCIMIIN
jgi:hypothetical protein